MRVRGGWCVRLSSLIRGAGKRAACLGAWAVWVVWSAMSDPCMCPRAGVQPLRRDVPPLSVPCVGTVWDAARRRQP